MRVLAFILCLLFLLFGDPLFAQGNPIYTDYSLSNMDSMLVGVYNSVIARSSTFVSIASGIGVVGAVIMISSHIYSKLLRQQGVDWAYLSKPFVILLGLVFYVPLLNAINTVLSPTVYATKSMVANENAVVESVLAKLADARAQTEAYAIYVGKDGTGDFDKYLEVNDLVDDDGFFGLKRIDQAVSFKMEAMMYRARNEMRNNVFWLMGWIYTAAVFIINTIRSFTLAVLGLIGPLALGFSLWPGFQSSFLSWAGRYITVYLWLPVANVFGFIIGLIQEQFGNIAIEIAQTTGTGTETSNGSADGLYLILLLTGIVGYFCVPAITNYIISASGASAIAGGMSGAGRMGMGITLLAASKILSGGGGGSSWGPKFNMPNFPSPGPTPSPGYPSGANPPTPSPPPAPRIPGARPPRLPPPSR